MLNQDYAFVIFSFFFAEDLFALRRINKASQAAIQVRLRNEKIVYLNHFPHGVPLRVFGDFENVKTIVCDSNSERIAELWSKQRKGVTVINVEPSNGTPYAFPYKQWNNYVMTEAQTEEFMQTASTKLEY